MQKPVRSALISVYYKDHLDSLAKELHKHGVVIYSTGGTQKFIEELGIPVVAVETLTNYPSILGGRVKTLHPKVFGGILARRDDAGDLEQLKQYEIPEIDLVVVDLYPFEETYEQFEHGKADEQAVIEKIDIGGISLIRAAAKNYKDTIIISSKDDYEPLRKILEAKNGNTDLADRRRFAAKAFWVSSNYDSLIFDFFDTKENLLPELMQAEGMNSQEKSLRYGENPHQSASFSGNLEEALRVLSGKELSYNNLVDIDAALKLMEEFSEPTVAIIKHTNSCGLASRPTISEAYRAAFACDTTSAFGGIIAANKPIDLATAEAMNNLFFEALAAPAFDADAYELLSQKKNRILIEYKEFTRDNSEEKSVLNGFLYQNRDVSAEKQADLKVVTEKQPTAEELSDLEFAIVAVKHLKSNGIALVKNKQLIGMGCGQTSRVDALQHAIRKSKEFGFDLSGAVMASDAFFPFPDCVNIAAEAGITAISQPGGSVKDQDSINAANAAHQAMVFTGVRHFKH
jgi:phosphoribosylaminoimidazolecarboxamide formyltransferase/IMP cyclohydrolase